MPDYPENELKHKNQQELNEYDSSRKVLATLDLNMTEEELEKVLEEADMDRDGRVCFEEFVLLMINK